MKKEGNKKMPTQRHKVTHNPIPTSLLTVPVLTRSYLPIPTSLFLSRSYPFYVGMVYIVRFCIVFSLYKATA